MPSTSATNSTVQYDHFTCIDQTWERIKSAIGMPGPNPAVTRLAQWQSAAKFSRTIERIRSPRRLVLTVIAIVLTFVWLGQAIAGVMLREAASVDRLKTMIPLWLGMYLAWNFIKAATQKPVEPFEWTETERELLLGSPLKRSEVIQYRCSTIARSAFTKSLIFTFVMIPDLAILPLGFLAILMALIFIDLIRIWIEIAVNALRPSELFVFRSFVLGATAIVTGRALACTMCTADFNGMMKSAAGLGFLLQLWSELQFQTNTWYGAVLLSPFKLAASIMTADRFTLGIYSKLILSAAIVMTMLRLTTVVDAFFGQRKKELEREEWEIATRKSRADATIEFDMISAPKHHCGIGSLAWRQWYGALNFKHSLLVSLLVPAGLSCMPSFATIDEFSLVANTTGALAFYSLVLLPASLKFDFRRDLDRLVVLKALPLSPLNVCIGQLAIPVMITSGFQLFTLLLVMVLSPYNPLFILGAMLVLLPFNLFIFSFENLAFLWYPHRLKQEGMQVLLRSILVFTAKSLIFGLAFATTFVWVLLAKNICETLSISWLTIPIVFSAGMFALILATAASTFTALVRAFQDFDPSADLVGLD